MVLQVGRFRERQAARFALEWLITGMQSFVTPQRRVAREAPVANVALERFVGVPGHADEYNA